MCFGGGSSDSGADEARAREEARRRRVNQGLERINRTFDKTFTDDFFDQREQAFLDFATPQLQQQYDDALEELTFALARAGKLNSSTQAERFADLQRDFDLQKTNVADQALEQASNLRSSVEQARSALVSQNNALGDVAAITNLANSQARAIQNEKPAFSPLGALFQNVSAGIATQADAERRGRATFNTGLFQSPFSGSGRTVSG